MLPSALTLINPRIQLSMTTHTALEPVPSFSCREARFKLDDDLILPANTRLEFEESLAKIRFHRTIYLDWGFGAVDPMGRSTILNFYGPPGTGKTMAADALAGVLNLPIIEISIAELESKFMGETARNIQAAFASAYEAGALLFFDEADTLLGKRLSSVTQGIDNEVNSMRSTLLIELERFEGVVVFATNFARNYDEAFLGRITHHVSFQLPDIDGRRQLWARMLVSGIPLGEARDAIIEEAATLSDGFSGRDIRNAMRLALPKAILAAQHTRHAAQLTSTHIASAIAQILNARANVASGGHTLAASTQAATRLLGLNS